MDSEEILLQALSGAASGYTSPYSVYGNIGTTVSDAGVKSAITANNSRDRRESLIAAALGGLTSGLFGGLAENDVREQNDLYKQVLAEALAGNATTRPDDLDANLFKQATDTAELFKVKRMLESEQAKQSLKAEVLKARLLEQAKEEGKLGAYGGGSDDRNLLNPIAKEIRNIENEGYERIIGQSPYKDFLSIRSSFNKLKGLAKEDSRPASIGMIYNLSKIWDPDGRVTDGDYKLNADAQSALDNAYGDWKSIVMGKGKLSAEAKKKILDAANVAYADAGDVYTSTRDDIFAWVDSNRGNSKNLPVPNYEPFDSEAFYKELLASSTPTDSTMAAKTLAAAKAEQARRNKLKAQAVNLNNTAD